MATKEREMEIRAARLERENLRRDLYRALAEDRPTSEIIRRLHK